MSSNNDIPIIRPPFLDIFSSWFVLNKKEKKIQFSKSDSFLESEQILEILQYTHLDKEN